MEQCGTVREGGLEKLGEEMVLLILGVGEGRGPPGWQIRAPLRKVLSREKG